jgi:hypothetical protein
MPFIADTLRVLVVFNSMAIAMALLFSLAFISCAVSFNSVGGIWVTAMFCMTALAVGLRC